ncbi:vomeronasal type-2 receptor 26-like [Xenopus laevis]|uniref:Vomeronasal type-2 receptor 26-like n=1 Tax=Xenopus laevis TaxID=8355 RepID=A0A8J1KR28_XENLA|nr:vomeronasal type-2 receptor 26-like [Xenopus laevis]
MATLFSIRRTVFLVVLMFQVLPAAAEMPSPRSTCQLSSSSDTKYFREGDLIVGGIFYIKDFAEYKVQTFKQKQIRCRCVKASSFRLYRYLLVFIYTIGEINKDPEILPNVTLGYHIFDSCDNAEKALEGTFSILSGTQQLIPNYSCWKNRKVVGFIGDVSSVSSLSMALLAGIYRYPQISYGSRNPVFNDRVQFPSFYRTIPDESSETETIVKLITHFGWKWVGLIVSDDETGLWAVYTMALALHKLYIEQKLANHPGQRAGLQIHIKPWQLNAVIHNRDFEMTSVANNRISIKGDPSTHYEIVKCFFSEEGGVQTVKVGSFDTSKPVGNQLYINTSADLWGPYFTQKPQSQCNEPCEPGNWKCKIEGTPPCCYKCAPCVEGQISNITDAQRCIRCSEYQKSNTEKNGCIPKNINYLSYESIMGATLSSISVLYSLTCTVILGVFIKYRETPVVKMNNQNLSCLLLISLTLCFLCTLLFIGRPTHICCLLRQVTFGIVFTISVSSVLAKTLTVIIAFNATKPGSKLTKYVGTQLSIILVIACFLGEMIISVVWLASNPPFPEADTLSDPDYIILQCNEGSDFFFFCIIGYIGTLALLSFIAAFLAKDFPDRFNEAKNITFSMLVFCSVWVTFVPAYLSSKGSRMVAVEIFAILSSSAGLLGCIFIPKCYIIFLRPDLNTKDNLVRKRQI